MSIRSTTISAVALLALHCAGCVNNPSVRLSWDEHAHSIYRMTRQPFPSDMEVDVDAMLTRPEVLQAKIDELKALELDPRTFPMQLTLEGGAEGRIEVLGKSARVTYGTEAADENERFLREMQEKMVGMVQLNTAIDRHGESRNPYLKSGQSNLVRMLFWFPDHPVEEGEHWQLPLVLTSLNTPFLADKTHRDNRVWINAIRERPGIGKVAEVVYLLREEIEGQQQMFVTDRAEPFRVTSTYFAVGEFSLDEKRWLRYVGRHDFAPGIIRTIELIALMPPDETDL